MTKTILATPSIVSTKNVCWDDGYQHVITQMCQQGLSLTQASGCMRTFIVSCYDYAQRFSPDYHGDFWHWYQQSDGGFFICPQMRKTYQVEIQSNYYDGAMNEQALGITVSLYALSVMAQSGNDFLIESYYRLRDFAAIHPESSAIFSAID